MECTSNSPIAIPNNDLPSCDLLSDIPVLEETQAEFATHNVHILNNDSIFRKSATTNEIALATDNSKNTYISRDFVTATNHAKSIVNKKDNMHNRWSTISSVVSSLGIMVFGLGCLSILWGLAGPTAAIVGVSTNDPLKNITLLIMITCSACALFMGGLYLYSEDKANIILEDIKSAKIDLKAVTKLQGIITDIFEFCDYIDDTDDKKSRTEKLSQNIIDTLTSNAIIAAMNAFSATYNSIARNLYNINDKIANISTEKPWYQQQYEYIKEQGLQEITRQSEELKNKSNELFNTIFSSLEKNLDSVDVTAIRQLKDIYIEKKLHNRENLFISKKASTPSASNNLANIQRDVENIVITAITNGIKNS